MERTRNYACSQLDRDGKQLFDGSSIKETQAL
jgi:hypothetical protein